MSQLVGDDVVEERAVSGRTDGQIESAVNAIDLGPIKYKMVHEEEGLGWPVEKVEAIERRYRNFLILAATSGREVVPTKDVDKFWHFHILDTRKYAADCEATFGYFLHHFPYLGLRGERNAVLLSERFEETKALYHSRFNERFEVRGEVEADCASCITACGDCNSSCGPEAAPESALSEVRPSWPEFVARRST